jgi:excisionase family DNA binding protein
MNLATPNSKDNPKLLLKASEVADRLSVSRATAYEMMAGGILPTVRHGRSVRALARGLDAWIERSLLNTSEERDSALKIENVPEKRLRNGGK